MLKGWNNTIALGTLLACASVLRLSIAWMDFPSLITQIPDDAFYYFGIARNLVEGNGVTFDGTSVTNGFHPLWFALIVPFFAFSMGDAFLPIRLSLLLATGFDCFTGLLIGYLVKRITQDQVAAWLAAFFYLFNPGIVKESINGLETTLTVCLIAISFLFYLPLGRSTPFTMTSRSSDWKTVGILLGLVILARTDNAILVVIMLMGLLISKRDWHALATVARIGSVTFCVVAPWFMWNWFQFGSIFQSSGEAYPYALRAVFFGNRSYSFLEDLLVGFFVLYQWLVEYIPLYYFLWQRAWGAVYYFLLLGSILLLILIRTPFTRIWYSWVRLTLAPIAGLLVIFLVHAFVRWYPRSWYFVPLVFFVAIVLGLTIAYVKASIAVRGQPLRYAILIILLTLSAGFLQKYIQDWNRYPWQIEMWEAAAWITANLPPTEKVGAFNAGIIGYLAHNRVVNLDGVVNAQAYHAIRQTRLSEWMCSQGIHFLADFSHSLKFYSSFMREDISFDSIKVWNLASETAANTHLNIYRISCRRE